MAGRELSEILDRIEAGENFLLSGGAGSGKTHSLVETITHLYRTNPRAKIACITYTNVAANEIRGRVPYPQLQVSTIHEFLWKLIETYQKNLKEALLQLIKTGTIKINRSAELEPIDFTEDFFDSCQIEYRDYKRLQSGIVSHDEVLSLATYLVENFPLLQRVARSRFQYIFVDEYQDTKNVVVELLLRDLKKRKDGQRLVVGFFGDAMQAIYDDGVGNLNRHIECGVVQEIVKSDNYRCSRSVISLINKIRNDGIVQEPAGSNVNGSITFLYSRSPTFSLQRLRASAPVLKEWNFEDHAVTKSLYLTHKLIANELGFLDLMNAFPKDRLVGDKKDALAKHLFKIQDMVSTYERREYNEFLKRVNFRLYRASDKSKLRSQIEKFMTGPAVTIGECVELADTLKLIPKDDTLMKYIDESSESYREVCDVAYSQLVALHLHEQGESPFSTQHGVKGAEFKNVFVLLDNGRWNNYNFVQLLEGTAKSSVMERTRKILYVCCSRAKEHLVVYINEPSEGALRTARLWFGEANVIDVESM